MATDSFTETTSTGWFGRIGSSIKGVLVGLVMIVISVVVLFWNEGRAVKTERTLEEGAKGVVSISADAVDEGKQGKLVHLTGMAKATGELSDPVLGIKVEALKLRRNVEMYQWKEESKSETRKKLGGGEETVTTYSYVKDWAGDFIDSSKFKNQAGHENPRLPMESEDWTATPITVGAYTLSPGLAGQIGGFTTVRGDDAVELPETVASKKLHRSVDGFYLGEDPAKPMVGDVRVSHEAALPGDVSVIAKLRGSSFEPYLAKAGGSIEMLENGNQSAEAMFASAHAGNRMLTWVLRAVGVLVMFIGFTSVFRPLSVLADVVPFVGNIVGVGTGLVSLLLTVPISLVIIGVAWIFYRPMIGIPLLLVAVVGFVLLIRKMLSQKRLAAA